MSASLVVGPRTAAYGAAELKQAAHKYGFAALVISIFVHFSVIGLYYLAPQNDVIIDDPRIPPPRIIDYTPHPYNPGVYEPPAVERGGGKTTIHEGTPVAVHDDPVTLEKTIPTIDEVFKNAGSQGTGGEYPPIVLPNDDSVPPEPFVAVEKYPEIIKAVAPVYPTLALQAGLEGRVFVKVWVDKQGKPRQVEILKSDYDIFNEAAIEAAKQYVFTPAYMNNGPVSVWIAIPFTFRLTGAR